MKLKLFSVFDEKAKSFIAPFAMPTDAMAVREFAGCVNDEKHAFGRNPEDYTLFRLGEVDVETGLLVADMSSLCLGVLVKKEKPL